MALIVGFLFGLLGMGYAMYGKKVEEYEFLIFGVLLMAYSYFIPGILWQTIIGCALLAAPFVIKRF